MNGKYYVNKTEAGIHRLVFTVRSYIQDRLKYGLKKSRTNQKAACLKTVLKTILNIRSDCEYRPEKQKIYISVLLSNFSSFSRRG